MISFRLNGKDVSVDAPEEADLLYVLLNDLKMNGSKLGCGRSQCGACTVLHRRRTDPLLRHADARRRTA